MATRRQTISLISGFTLGVLLLTTSTYLVSAIVTLLFLGGFWLFNANRQIFLLFGIGSLVALVVVPMRIPTVRQAPTDEISLVGNVSSSPEYRITYQRFVFTPAQEVQGVQKILVSFDLGRDLRVGDLVLVTGKMEIPENFMSENGREFDYQNYLLARSVSHVIQYARVEELGSRQTSLFSWLDDVRRKYLELIAVRLPEPHASLAGGITVGVNDAFDQRSEDLFRRAGLTHIVVLSGYNIAIVTEAIGATLAFLPYAFASSISVVGIWLFVLLVGASSTIIRAGVMATIAVVSRLRGREANGFFYLVIAVGLMLLWNPLLLVYDPSFQLSVLATIGMVSVAPTIEWYLSRVPTTLGLREIVATTLSAQLMVTPWLVYLMGEVSVIAPLANLIVLPVIPFAMLAVFLVAVSSLSIPGLAPVFTFGSHILLSYVFFFVEHLGELPFATVSVNYLPILVVVISYLLIGYLCYRLHLKQKYPPRRVF